MILYRAEINIYKNLNICMQTKISIYTRVVRLILKLTAKGILCHLFEKKNLYVSNSARK